MSVWRHLRAIGLLPVMVTVVVPALVVWRSGARGPSRPLAIVGISLIVFGLALVAWTVALFARVSRGTLAPWDPTSRLVVSGPYRHVRNPMISGVLAILLGEAALFASVPLLLWLAAVFAANAVYFPLVEEPGLRRRFGEEYDAYRANVPRWLPRVRPGSLKLPPWNSGAGPARTTRTRSARGRRSSRRGSTASARYSSTT
ncbi:MAG: methyltransferase family protein [Gaiellaceae bacterium]